MQVRREGGHAFRGSREAGPVADGADDNGAGGGVVEVPKYDHGSCGGAVQHISAVQGTAADSNER